MPTELNNVYLASGAKLSLALGTDPTKVYGSTGADTLTIAVGVQVVLDGSFNRGNDIIKFAGNAASYNIVKLNSSTIQITDASGTSVTIPVGSTGTHIQFADADRVLSGSAAGLVLGDQAITATAAALSAGTAPSANYTLSVNAPTVTEGDTGSKTLSYKLTLDRAPTSDVTVSYETLDTGSATANDDFVPGAGTVTFLANQSVAYVTVTVLGDTIVEAPETVALRLSGAKLVSAVTAAGTIIDNDTAPVDPTSYTVTSGDIATANAQNNAPVSVNVGNSGTKTVTIQSDAASANGGVIINGDANVTVNAGAAGDTITISGNGNNTVNAGTGTGNDTVRIFGAGSNNINVGSGNDTVVGGLGNDTIVVGTGALGVGDSIDGGAGLDTVRISGTGNAVADANTGLVGATLVGVENIVLDGTTLDLGKTALATLVANGLVSISGHADSSVITIKASNNDVIDLTGLSLTALNSIRVNAGAGNNATLVLNAQQIAQVGSFIEVGTSNVTIQTSAAGAVALGNKAPGVVVTVSDTLENIQAAGNSLNGATIQLNAPVTVAQALSAAASHPGITYDLADTAANLALAPRSAFANAVTVAATTVATAAQATSIQDSLTNAGHPFTDAAVTLNVADTASLVSAAVFDDTINADHITPGSAVTVAQAIALYAKNTGATFAIVDSATAVHAAIAGNAVVLNAATSVTLTSAATNVTTIGLINLALTGAKVVAPGYNLSDSLTALSGASAIVHAANNVTVTQGATAGFVTVAEALTAINLSNTGAKGYVLKDSYATLVAANSNVISNATTVESTTTTLSQSQMNQLVQVVSPAKLVTGITVLDTVANLLLLSPAAAAEAIAFTPTSNASVSQLVALKALTGAAMPNVTVVDTAANLVAGVAVTTTLTQLTAAATSVSMSDAGTVAQVKAINTALAGELANTFTLADTVANLVAAAGAGGEDANAVDDAAQINVQGAATLAQIGTINGVAGLTLGTTLAYALSDTATNLLVAGNANAVDKATSVNISDATTVQNVANVALAFSLTGAAPVLGTNVTYSLKDTFANLFTVVGQTQTPVAAVAGAGTVTLSDTLANVKTAILTTANAASKAEIDNLNVTGVQLATAAVAADVNAVAAVKPTTYTLADTLANLTAPTGTDAEKAAIATMVGAAATVIVDSNASGDFTSADTALTVAQFNTLDAATNGTIKANVTGTVAELAAGNAAAAIAAAKAASGTVTVTGATTATVNDIVTLTSRGLSTAAGGELANINIVDTAAAIKAASASLITGMNGTVSLSDNGTLNDITVALANKVYATNGAGSAYGNYSLADTAANLFAASANLIGRATTVTATTNATVTEANTLAGLTTLGTVAGQAGHVVYNVAGTASALANGANAAGTNGAVNIIASTAALVAEADAIHAATNSGTETYAITDSAAALAVTTNAQKAAIEAATGVVTANTVANAVQATAIAAFAKAVVYGVSDTAAALGADTVTAAALNEAVNITATGTAFAAQAGKLFSATNSGTTTIENVDMSVADALALHVDANDSITDGNGADVDIVIRGEPTVAEASAIAAKFSGANFGRIGFDKIVDTAANLAAAPAATLQLATVVQSSTPATIAQVAAFNGNVDLYAITDSFANIMADDDANGTVNASGAIVGHTVTVTDAALTVAQASSLRAIGASGYTYSVADQDSRIVVAMANAPAALSGATSVSSYDGTVLHFASIGGTLRLAGTRAEIGGLSSVLKGANVLYEVSVSELANNTGVFTSLAGNEKYRVTDTMANLLSGNALVAGPNALALVATTAGTVAEANSLVSLNATASYSLNDSAAALAAAAGGSSRVDGAINVTANTAATFAQAQAIEAETNSGTTSYSISDLDTAFNFPQFADAVDGATNITVTGTAGLTAFNAQRIINGTNTGSTTIALVKDTAANLVAMTKGANDTITAIALDAHQSATVAQVTTLKGLAGTVTYALNDTAANLVASSYLNGATTNGTAKAIVVNGNATVEQAIALDAATPADADTVYAIADTATHILSATAALLARDSNTSVQVTDTTVTAAVATQLATYDSVQAGFTIFQNGAAGVYTIVDTYANLTAAANQSVVQGGVVTATGVLSVAQGTAVKALNALATFDVTDTYAQLATSLATTQAARDVVVSNLISASQATNAYNTFDNGPGTVTYSVRDTAANITNAGNATAVTNAASVSLSNSASVVQARLLSEMTNLSGGYAISDVASTIQGALNSINGAGAQDRETVLGATSVTVTGFATVNEALGVAAAASRGLYTVPNITYSIQDSAANLLAGLSGVDSNGMTIARSIELLSSGDLNVHDAQVLLGLANFHGYDHDSNAATAGIYNIVDTAANVQIADTSLIGAATAVTANGTINADTIDFSSFGRALSISAGAGADNVFGSIYGDTITGGTGIDNLTGGDGADRFVLDSAVTADRDVIADFVAGTDKVVLDTMALTGLGAGSGTASSGGATLVKYAESGATVAVAEATADTAGYAAAILVVSSASGVDVYYDSDTHTVGGSVLIASLTGVGLNEISSSSFVLI